MILQNKVDEKRFYVFLGISALINILMILIIPSCSKVSYKKELEYENIKTGLISIVDTVKKEYKTENNPDTLNTDTSFSKETVKSEITEKISPLENTLKNAGDSQIIKNNVSTSKPKFTGPSREEGAVEGLVLTTNSKNNLRTSAEGLSSLKNNSESNETDLNIKGNNIKGIDSISKNLEGGSKTLETGTLEKNSIGLETNNQGSTSKDVNISIKDTGVNISIPKNISYSTVDVTGGRVVFRKYVPPIYPEEAEKNAWSGDVEVEFLVREGKSTFSGITEKSGYTVIDRAVERAAKNWVLAIEKNGMAVNGKVRVRVEFNF